MKPKQADHHPHGTTNRSIGPFRVFVSYYQADRKLANDIIHFLGHDQHGLGFDVRGMHELEAAEPFANRIREWIAHSHVMIAVITKHSVNRPWVNQEIGYGLAQHIPVFAVVSGVPPEALGMLRDLQVIVVGKPGDLRKRLLGIDWEKTARNCGLQSLPVFSCDNDAAERTKMLAVTAHTIGTDYQKARIRQRSRLTSFSIPRVLGQAHWNCLPHKTLQNLGFWLHPRERREFEALTETAGCDLIIDPDYYDASYDPVVQCARLSTLRDFLDGMDDHRVRVVVQKCGSADSMTIIGNHWAMFSASVATAFYMERESISTWHAPTVESLCADFDENFERLWQKQNRKIRGRSSRRYAIQRIDQALRRLRCLWNRLSRVLPKNGRPRRPKSPHRRHARSPAHST